MKITKQQAGEFLLAYHHLLPPRSLTGTEGILEYFNKTRCIQFDPLNMVGYNPHLVLQSRIKDYQPGLLNELLYKDRLLLDIWDKNMSICPVEDWPYFQRYRDRARERFNHKDRPAAGYLDKIREEIRERGPLCSSDLDYKQKVRWSWAPTRLSRAALESMYAWGELIVHHKKGTRKFYDFTQNHIPAQILSCEDPNKSSEDYYMWHVKRRIKSTGLLWNRASDAWLGIKNLKTEQRNRAFEILLEKDEIIKIEIDTIKYPFYICKEDTPLLTDRKTIPPVAAFLAPLDNLLWDRKLIKEIFDFEYVWEVYKPTAERKYGYYVLPIIYGNRFIGRLEPVMDKKENILIIKNLWPEKGVKISGEIQDTFQQCLDNFREYTGARELKVL